MRNQFLVCFLFAVSSLAFGQADETRLENYIIDRQIDADGREIIGVKIPGRPPANYRVPIVDPTESSVTISNVPAYSWSFGCFATSAAMMAGYYDNIGYANMYNGPTNGGIMPMNNSIWGTVILNGESRDQCPLSATRNGVDGRTTRGHVDDYWIQYGNTDPDPYISNSWIQHTTGDCTGDFMGTNQSVYGNGDGGTTIYWVGDGSALHNYSGCEPSGKDGCHGLRQFFESRGYNVSDNYTQLIYGYNGNTLGFTYEQYKNEIDNGRPVFIQVVGHTMLGYGYDDASQTVLLHDTWDYNNHAMVWGGSYNGMDHFAVTCITLAPVNSLATAVPLFSSQNIYTAQLVEQTCIAYNPDINTLMFTARGHSGVLGTGNDICTAVSTNGGISFTNAVGATAPSQGGNRFPSGTLFNPAGNTSPLYAKKVFTAPIANGAGWVGNNFATNNWSNNSLYNQFRSASSMGDMLIRGGLDVDANGIAHQAAVEFNSTSTYAKGFIFKGVYNVSSGAFIWTDQNVNVPAYVNSNNNEYILRANANVAFSPDGSVGYAMFIGSDNRATTNNLTSYQPIIFKSTDMGASWQLLDKLNLTNNPVMDGTSGDWDGIWPLRRTAGLADPTYKPCFAEHDIVVDNNGNLHIIALCKGAFSDHQDSLEYTYTLEKGALFDISNIGQGNQWNVRYIDSLDTRDVSASESGYGSGSSALGWNHRLQASRSADGKVVLAVWSDTDFIFFAEEVNLFPDIRGQAYRVTDGYSSPVVDFTNMGPSFGENFFHFVSPVCMTSGLIYTVPVTKTDIRTSNDPGMPVYHSYLNGISFLLPPESGLVAGFTSTPSSGTAPLVVLFNNASTGSPTVFEWNFGDPASGIANTSTLENPTHTFNSPGNYTVSLTVYEGSNSDSYSSVITVSPAALAPPENLQASVNGQDVHLTWDAPVTGGTGAVANYILDDGAYEHGYSFDPGSDAWLGNEFATADSGTITSVDLYFMINTGSGSDQLSVDIFDSNGILAGSSGLFTPSGDDFINVPINNIYFNGTFYAMVHWNNNSGATNHLGLDENGSIATDDPEWYYDGTSWDKLSNIGYTGGAFGIRAHAVVAGGKDVVYGRFAGLNAANHPAASVSLVRSERSVNTNNNDISSKLDLSDYVTTGLTGYKVYRNSVLISSLDANTTSYDDLNLPNGSYSYTVTAIYGAGESTAAGPAEIVTGITNPAPLTTCGQIACPMNSSISVPVTVEGFTDITAISLRLEYDPAVMTYTGYSNLNSSLSGMIINNIAVSATVHKVLISWSDVNPKTLSDESKLFDLDFNYHSGNTSLTWNNSSNNGADCEYADAIGDPLIDIPTSQFYHNGAVIWRPGHNVTGVYTSNNTANTPLDNIKVVLMQGAIRVDSVFTNPSGEYAFTSVEDGTYEIVSSTGKPWAGVNATDAIKIQRHFTGLEILNSPVRIEAADVNMTNSVNATDAIKTKRRFTGLDNSFLRGDWAFARPITGGNSITVAGADIEQDMQGLCVGDVNGSNIPAPGKTVSAGVEMEISGEIEVIAGEIFEIPVKMTQSMQMCAVSLVLDFPADKLEIMDVKLQGIEPIYKVTENQLRLAWSEVQPLTGKTGDLLLSIRCRTANTTGLSDQITLTAGNESELADESGDPIMNAVLTCPAIKIKNSSATGESSISSIEVYPNPAEDKVTVTTMLLEEATINYELIDATGRLVLKTIKEFENRGENKSTFNVQSLNPGFYTLKVTISCKGKLESKIFKLIIQ